MSQRVTRKTGRDASEKREDKEKLERAGDTAIGHQVKTFGLNNVGNAG